MNIDSTCNQLRELHQQRVDLHRAEKTMSQRVFAKCMRWEGGDQPKAKKLYEAVNKNSLDVEGVAEVSFSSVPIIEARTVLCTARAEIEKTMANLATELPVWSAWGEQVRGFGLLSLATIVGEAGNLGEYANQSKLRKRMGMAVINGERQRKKAGDAAIEHGYNPSRRSAMWNIGQCLIKVQGRYRSIYIARHFTEVEKARAEGLTVATTTAGTVTSWTARGLPKPEKVSRIIADQHRSCGHIANRAKRYAEQKFLNNLWTAWRDPALAPPDVPIDQLEGVAA